MFCLAVAFLLHLLSPTFAARDPPGFEDGSDLESFITRPDLRPLKYIVTKHHPDSIAPGYWFVAHYPSLFDAPGTWRHEHLPYQTGIHIYDNNGDLVWSGARYFRNTNALDFKTAVYDGEHHLSFYIGKVSEDNVPDQRRQNGGVTMNSRYEEVSRIGSVSSLGMRGLDVHEFTILPTGKSVLLSVNYFDEADAADLGQDARRLLTYGFQEIERGSEKLLFDWEPLRHGVSLSESVDASGMDISANETYWDWFHVNSIDKNADGDYLVSGRHTSCVYKVSRIDGSIIWRLGGKKSDFRLQGGVHFQWQHHARFLADNDTTTIISVFDNAGEDLGRNKYIPQRVSAGKIIKIDHTTMTASLLRGFQRPDKGKRTKLGSVQLLGSDPEKSNVLVDWAQGSFISEYDGNGQLIMEAKGVSDRMWTYRAYKLPWIGNPSRDELVLKSMPTLFDQSRAACTHYVSWNGATEVDAWSFYSSESREGPYEKLVTIPKVGFETSWTTSTIKPFSYVEGINKDGSVLGKSNVTALMLSRQWMSVDVDSASSQSVESDQPAKSSSSAVETDQSANSTNQVVDTAQSVTDSGSDTFFALVLAVGPMLCVFYILVKMCTPRHMGKWHRYTRLAGSPLEESPEDRRLLGS